jgi:cardiolipin synthase (CMP-forming)
MAVDRGVDARLLQKEGLVVAPQSDGPRGESSEHLQDVWTVANVITVLRLLLIPFFFSVLLSDRAHADTLAFALFAAAAATDWLDGMIARRTGTVTAIGKVIDPLVDRLLLASGVIGLYLIGRVSLWLVGVLVARDVYLLWGAYRLERHGERMPVTYLGKATTAILLTGFSLLILGQPSFESGGFEYLLGEPIVYVGIVLSLASAVHYTILARRLVAGAKSPRPTEPRERGCTMRAVIMAGGEGSRLRPLTSLQPKPMVPIVNQPVMEHIIGLVKHHGITDIVATLAFMPQVIQDYFGDGEEWGTDVLRARGDTAGHSGFGEER